MDRVFYFCWNPQNLTMKRSLLAFLLLCVIVTTRSMGQAPIPINGISSIDTCAGTDISFTVNDANPDTYSWVYADGTNPGFYPCTDGVFFSGSNTRVLTLHTDKIWNWTHLLTLECSVTHPGGGSTEYSIVFTLNEAYNLPPIVAQKTSIVCGGTNDVIYTVDSRSKISSNIWAYSGSGAAITKLTDTSVKISFGPAATSGTLSIIGQNKCGFSPETHVPVTVNSQQIAAPAGTLGGPSVCSSQSISPMGTTYSDAATCGIIASITPSGTSPVSGNIQSCAVIDGNVQTYNNVSYVQRHFNLMPATNASSSTATTTLYFTQGDFNAYNASQGGPSLPSTPTDAAGIANLRISQFDGTGTSPGTYTSQRAVIDPDDNHIVWNASSARWEVSFSHTGFGGFFVSGASLLIGPPVITTQPTDVLVCAGTSHFGYTSAYAPNVSNRTWQLSQDGGVTWSNIVNSADFQMIGIYILDVYGDVNLNNSLIRCILSNAGGNDTSRNALITVNAGPPVPPRWNDSIAAVCQGGSRVFSIYGVEPKDTIFFSISGPTVNHSGLFDTTVLINFNVSPGLYALGAYVANACGVAHSFNPIFVDPSASASAGDAGQMPECVSYPVYPIVATTYSDGNCRPIAAVKPSGANPVTGSITSCVTVDASVQSFGGIPYVPRHYSLEPAAGGATSTATVTLYFTQGDFDAYNSARGSNPALPTGPSDATGIANLHVTQFHGTGTTPDTYVGGSGDINPNDNNIVWNASASRWEVTFDIAGFSGFFVSGSSIIPLPLTMGEFSGKASKAGNQLHWTTTMEENTAYFEIQREGGDSVFRDLAKVAAAGNSNQLLPYDYLDASAVGAYSYRLKMVDIDGKFTYSRIVVLGTSTSQFSIRVLPNPAHQPLSLTVGSPAAAGAVLTVTDISGKKMVEKHVILQKGINSLDPGILAGLPQGMYLIGVATDKQQQTIKFVRE